MRRRRAHTVAMNILILGGTRNIGHFLTHRLVADGHRVAVLNRGRTPDELPVSVERLVADRTERSQLEQVLRGRTFDVVVDNALYKASEAEMSIELLRGRAGRYIFLSTGQVYLVREGLQRPFKESDYLGRVMPAPKAGSYGLEEWSYGMDKRRVEDAMASAWEMHRFPFTSLRLPMVNSERDHFFRLYNYVLRLKDGSPILAPETPNYALRHVYGQDVVEAIIRLIETGIGIGKAYNISQDETVGLEEFLEIVAGLLGVEARIERLPFKKLEAQGFLPDCSPFSERWMSELDNTVSKQEFSMVYTPLTEYLEKLVRHYTTNPPPKTASYRRRRAETAFLEFARQAAAETTAAE
ncbi:MAG: NAD-dependent epimerase/dehydratase family protein [Chloroflexi bacterium]|nr:NAD-dependent epimerase/dehydratase family protein [Chloroflexota bacterium]